MNCVGSNHNITVVTYHCALEMIFIASQECFVCDCPLNIQSCNLSRKIATKKKGNQTQMNTENLAHIHDHLFSEKSRVKFIKSHDDISFVIESPLTPSEPTIGYLFLHRHNKSVNVLDKLLLQKCSKLFEHVDKYVNENKVHVLVLYSLKKSFVVGADVNMIYPIENPSDAEKLAQDGHDLLFRFEKLSIPTVAAIHGNCLGGGLEIALSCSHRIASNDKSTQLGLPEVKLGLLPGAGGCVRLPRMIGLQEALQLILTGATISAKKAKRLGIIDEVISSDEGERGFFEGVRQYAIQLKLNQSQLTDKYSRRTRTMRQLLLERNPVGRSILEYQTNNYLNSLTKGHYPAPYVALHTIMSAYTAPTLEEASKIEITNFGKLVCTRQAKSLISLFQMIEGTKRIENYCNPTKLIPVTKLGVVGSGVMGSGIAQLAAFKNYQVYMKDIDEAFVQNGMKRVNSLFNSLVTKRKITELEREKYMSNITAGTTYSQLSDTQVIIEAAVEREDVKQEILKTVEELNPNVIFATNTSSIPVTSISAMAKRKENILGMHFFNPIHKLPLVEIVVTKYTSEVALGTIYQLALDLGKIPIVVNDGPGFLITRLFAVYCLEASRLALEGSSFEQVDSILYDFGLPSGPFRIMDESGLDIGLGVFPVLAKKLGLEFEQYNALHDLVKGENACGRKVGKGFYVYDSTGKRVGVNPAAVRIFNKYRTTKQNEAWKNTQYVRESSKDIVDRCILTLVNEATKCLEEGIVNNPEDIDLGMILGLGFPPFRGGGLLGYVDQRGIVNVTKRLHELSRKYGDHFHPTKLLQKMAKNNQKFFPERVHGSSNLSSKL
jgi:3-hydroxyacyl-CoA dehydrogenase/enoyl-CoA hydratase/3-hydroxybutyryl-CoA epimerase